jgi:hypothetical protein
MFKGKEIQAIQWDGHNTKAVFDFCGDSAVVTVRDEIYIHREGRLLHGMYIVRVGNRFKLFDCTTFEAMFE